MKHLRMIALEFAACLIMSPSPSAGQSSNFIATDTTINRDLTDVVVGYASHEDQIAQQNGTSPTVTIVSGGLAQNVTGFNGSTINMLDGRVVSFLRATDMATVTLSGGRVSALAAGLNGTANMTAGSAESIAAVDNGNFNVTGGEILSGVQLFGSSMGKISGVIIGTIVDGKLVGTVVDAHDQSMLELIGVTVPVTMRAFNTSQFKLNNTTVHGDVLGLGQNTVEVRGSNLRGIVQAFQITVTGSTLGGGIAVAGAGANGTVSGTQAASVFVGSGGATLSVTGSMIAGGGSASAGGVLTASSTDFATAVTAFANTSGPATISLTGGKVGDDVTAHATGALATITLNATPVEGNVAATGGLSATPNAVIQINGGSVSKSVTANGRSSITLISTTVGENATANSDSFSLVDIQGGSITGNAEARNSGAELRLSDAMVMGDVRASNRGLVRLAGGNVQGNLVFTARGSGVMSGGTVAGMADLNCLTFTMSGGSIAKNATIKGFSEFSIQSGTFGGDVIITESAFGTISASIAGNLKLDGGDTTISGGSIAGDLINSFGIARMTGGTVQGTALTNTGNALLTISGGEISFGIAAFSTSQITMSGGHAGEGVVANQQSTINMSGGSVSGGANPTKALVRDTATLNLSGTALIDGDLKGEAQSTVNFSGGGVQSANISGNSTLNLSGSAVVTQNVELADSAKVRMSGGKVNGDLIARGSGNVSVTAGVIGGELEVQDNSSLTMQGGVVEILKVFDSSNSLLEGGTLSNSASAFENATLFVGGTTFIAFGLGANDTSTITMDGGRVGGKAFANQGATLNVSGSAVIVQNLISQGTVNMSGGSVGGDSMVENNGRLVLTGGSIAGKIVGTESGDIAMTGGTVASIEARQDQPGGGVTIGGGQITGRIDAFSNSVVLIAAGAVAGNVRALGNSTVEVESVAALGGTLTGFDFSTVNMRGGTVGVGLSPQNLDATENATINLSGGTVGGALRGFDNSTINMSGGTVFGRVLLSNSAKFNFTGGRILGGIGGIGLMATADEVLTITALDDATISIQGVDLSAKLMDPNHQSTSSLYQLTGLLADGTSISGGSMVIQNNTAATFGLVIVPHWTADADGAWSNPANWHDGVPNSPGATARFLDKITANRTITVDGNFTADQLVFNDTDTYTLTAAPAGASITLQGDVPQGPEPKINVAGGTHQINSPLILTANTEIAVAASASLHIATGLSIPTAAGTLTKTGPGNLSVPFVRNASLDIQLGAVRILPNGASTGTSVLSALSISPAALLDLSNNALILKSPAMAMAGLDQLRQQLIQGRASTGGVASGKWNGASGITSSTAAQAFTDNNKETLSIGYALNSDLLTSYTTFLGQPVSDSDILIRLTKNADANLDGIVNNNDITILAGFYRPGTLGRHWYQADFNYDGETNNNDITILAGFYAPNAPPLTASPSPLSAVPEPSLSLLLLPLGAVLTRPRGR